MMWFDQVIEIAHSHINKILWREPIYGWMFRRTLVSSDHESSSPSTLMLTIYWIYSSPSGDVHLVEGDVSIHYKPSVTTLPASVVC